MWKGILKVQELTSRTLVNTEFRSAPKPEEEDDPCNKRLKALSEKIKNWTEPPTDAMQIIKESDYELIPEDVACKALEIIDGLNYKRIDTGNDLYGDLNTMLYKEHHIISHYVVTYNSKLMWGSEYQKQAKSEIHGFYSLRLLVMDNQKIIINLELSLLDFVPMDYRYDIVSEDVVRQFSSWVDWR